MEGLVGSHSYHVFTFARCYQYKTWDMFCSWMYLPSSLSKFETDGCDMPRLGNTFFFFFENQKGWLTCVITADHIPQIHRLWVIPAHNGETTKHFNSCKTTKKLAVML